MFKKECIICKKPFASHGNCKVCCVKCRDVRAYINNLRCIIKNNVGEMAAKAYDRDGNNCSICKNNRSVVMYNKNDGATVTDWITVCRDCYPKIAKDVYRTNKMNGVYLECEQCGKPFYRKYYQYQKVKHHFCCRQCSFDFKIEQNLKNKEGEIYAESSNSN